MNVEGAADPRDGSRCLEAGHIVVVQLVKLMIAVARWGDAIFLFGDLSGTRVDDVAVFIQGSVRRDEDGYGKGGSQLSFKVSTGLLSSLRL